jgi:type I restriction enzyme S subunit
MSEFVQEQLRSLLAGSALKRVSVGKNANLKFVYTDNMVEQQEIVSILDKKCIEINSCIEDKKKQLDVLAEYKKSIIYEYVTGKKEVPVI